MPAEGVRLLGSRHVGQHGEGCPGCVVCPTCKQRVDDHDLDAILACSAFQESKKEQFGGPHCRFCNDTGIATSSVTGATGKCRHPLASSEGQS